MAVLSASPLAASHVSIAVQAMAEASYVYTTTKSKAEARVLNPKLIWIHSKTNCLKKN